MSKNKELKYRVICHVCNKPFDVRNGKNYYGHIICEDCYNKIPFKTLDDYKKEC